MGNIISCNFTTDSIIKTSNNLSHYLISRIQDLDSFRAKAFGVRSTEYKITVCTAYGTEYQKYYL